MVDDFAEDSTHSDDLNNDQLKHKEKEVTTI